jgi:hypothetical protein
MIELYKEWERLHCYCRFEDGETEITFNYINRERG